MPQKRNHENKASNADSMIVIVYFAIAMLIPLATGCVGYILSGEPLIALGSGIVGTLGSYGFFSKMF